MKKKKIKTQPQRPGKYAVDMATWQRSIQSRRGPPPPEYTCCHHLSVARRHSLSQQMRGLSERAPQFLRDAGEQGGSRHARLWFLPTARTDRTGSLGARSVAFGCWNFGRRATCAREGGVFLLGRAKVLVLVSFFVIRLFWNLFEIIGLRYKSVSLSTGTNISVLFMSKILQVWTRVNLDRILL